MSMRVRALVLASAAALALPSAAGIGHATETKPFASDVSREAGFMEGEPTVAINPTNPGNLLVTYTRIGEPYQFRPSHALSNEACGLAVSHDGGKTFQRRLLTVTDTVHNSCGDPYAVFDKRGTAYISFDIW